MSDELWRSAVGFANYEVSNLGRVRRVTGGRGVRAGRVLRPQKQPNGYLCVTLWQDGVSTRRTVHTLVYEAFVGVRSAGVEINHLDGVKANNATTNLQGCTSAQNKAHAVANGLAATGLRNGATKLRADQVIAIRAAAASGRSQRSIAAEFGVSQGHVSDIVRGRKRRTVVS
ncbi:HNH endonuclease [Gordonia phage Phlop]|nr:HNH endonuclease [Gordonia phage Wizard]YP_009284855.1 HNH endonuclease [Gordonia phage Twister6]YP_010096783.1 HNH endonuclease [Gordonia phage KimmyK]YP_010098246.1 HNH endonuclease [Gordonia phage TillyBobJoe]YP_010102048.1 HNH endonuclease [Gordonia phage SmokingBunny]YP_010102336.1 HNH endonuclease [Gordonia phage Arri]YP_010102431.1 HNH endonuclease [Gordonia phage Valary]YP_010103098.1 HNH endonuclease [Gordonia phage RogerDodger]YP_010104302.1 HNH endonuclease [Gordonia phage Fir